MWYVVLLLCIVPTFASNYKVYRTHNDGPHSNGFYHHFFPLRGSTIRVWVRSERDAYVALTTGPDDNNPMFEILIGAYENKYLYIRKNRDTKTDIYVYTNNILSSTEYRGFWIELVYWNDFTTKDYDGWNRRKDWLNISVGYEGHTEPLITRLEENPINIEFFGISSWGVETSWKIKESQFLVPQRKIIYALTSKAKYPSYHQFLRVTQSKIKFRVKAAIAWIALTSGQAADINTRKNDFFEIVLKGWPDPKDLKSVMTNKLFEDSAEDNTENLLNRYEYRGFWIELSRDKNSNQITTASVRIGREDEDKPFFEWKDPHPVPVNYYSYATTAATGEWTLEEISEPSVFQGKRYVETTNSVNKFVYEQFFKVTSKKIWFEIRSGQDASVALTLKAQNSWPMYQINIGAKSKKITVKRNDKEIATAMLNKTLVQDEYRKFWITFETNNNTSQQGPTVQICVGYENEDTPFMNVSNNDTGFDIKYYSVATLGKSGSGFWILEDNQIKEEDRVLIKKIDSTALLPSLSQFRFFPVYSNVIEFKVRAGAKACITLSTKTQYAGNNTVITLGDHYLNQFSKDISINTISKNEVVFAKYEGNLLNYFEYHAFWIKFSNITLQNGKQAQLFRVGRMDEVPPFLAWVDDDFYPINYFGINVFDGSSNSWIIKTKAKVPLSIQYDEDIYTLGDGHIRFYPTSNNIIQFKVQASRDAVIYLLPSNNDTTISVKIVLGQNENTESIIYKNGVMKSKIKSGLLNPIRFREFWISWYIGYHLMAVSIGRDGELHPMLYFADIDPFHINYIGFTTPSNVTGTWSMPIE